MLQCLHLDTPLLKQQNTKKLTKNNCVHLGQILDPKDTKRPKSSSATFEEPGAKTGCWEQKHSTELPPAHNTTRGVGGPPKPPSGPTPGHTPTLTPYQEQACPTLGSEQTKELLFVLSSPCCSRGRSKALPEFLVRHLINFY